MSARLIAKRIDGSFLLTRLLALGRGALYQVGVLFGLGQLAHHDFDRSADRLLAGFDEPRLLLSVGSARQFKRILGKAKLKPIVLPCQQMTRQKGVVRQRIVLFDAPQQRAPTRQQIALRRCERWCWRGNWRGN